VSEPEWNLAPHRTATAQPQQLIFEVDFSNTAQLLKKELYSCTQQFTVVFTAVHS